MRCKIQNLIPLFLIIIINNSICQNKSNPYGLKIVSDIRAYNDSLLKNPKYQLIDLEKTIKNLKLDIRYATENNFTKQKVYPKSKAYLRKEVSDSLSKVAMELEKLGFGIKVFDAYRPYSITLKFYEVYPDTMFVAAPWRGSKHNYACAIDLTLYELGSGIDLEMPTEFDDFSDKAGHMYNSLSEIALKNRGLLLEIMEKYGFMRYEAEWWHYDFYNWKNYNIMDLSFDDLN